MKRATVEIKENGIFRLVEIYYQFSIKKIGFSILEVDNVTSIVQGEITSIYADERIIPSYSYKSDFLNYFDIEDGLIKTTDGYMPIKGTFIKCTLNSVIFSNNEESMEVDITKMPKEERASFA